MWNNLLSDFKLFLAEREDSSTRNRRDDQLSKLNIDGEKQDSFFGMPIPSSVHLGPDVNGDKDPGSKEIRWFDIVGTDAENGDDKTYVTIQDISGPCNERGINSKNEHLPCSPTHGRKWRMTRKNLQFLKLPPGLGGAGAGSPMGGGMPGGGMPL